MDTRLIPEGWRYQTEDVIMLPFSDKHPDIFPENFWSGVYYRLREDGIMDTMFPGMSIKTLDQFICYVGKPERLGRVICCLKNPNGAPEPVGMGWLCEYEHGRASFGFGFFKKMWGNRLHVDLSRFMLLYWFTEMKVSALYGTTLNPIAKSYSKRFGFQQLCVLPKFFFCNGGLVPAHLIVLEKQVFEPYYLRWLQGRLEKLNG